MLKITLEYQMQSSGILVYLYGCMVCKKLLEAERLSRSCPDHAWIKGGWGVGGG